MLDPARVRVALRRACGCCRLAARLDRRARRETVIGRGPAGMVSVAGGKLTTWRAIGRRAAAMALAARRLAAAGRPPPLPGAAAPADDRAAISARPGRGSPATCRAALGAPLRHRCGADVLAAGRDRPELLERIAAGWPRHLGAGAVCARPRVGVRPSTDVLRGGQQWRYAGLDADDVRRGVRAQLGGGSGGVSRLVCAHRGASAPAGQHDGGVSSAADREPAPTRSRPTSGAPATAGWCSSTTRCRTSRRRADRLADLIEFAAGRVAAGHRAEGGGLRARGAGAARPAAERPAGQLVPARGGGGACARWTGRCGPA